MDAKLLAALNDWRTLNHELHAMREDQVKDMLDYELTHDRRMVFCERLHQRYNTLRVQRERAEILGSLV